MNQTGIILIGAIVGVLIFLALNPFPAKMHQNKCITTCCNNINR